MIQKTAIEKLKDLIRENAIESSKEFWIGMYRAIKSIDDQGIELEKQQIIDAFEAGQKETANGYFIKSGEQYYNQNFKNPIKQ